jgi:epoxyqueuosine reductase
LVDIELAYDAPFGADHCGSCTRCLDACPTQAFVGPHQLDSRQCISFWTIEHRGMMPDLAATRLDGWVFGCDVCQEVCPWNRKAPAARLAEFAAREEWTDPDLIEWLNRDQAEWRALLRGAAQMRSKRAGLLRNAALVLGNRRVAEAAAALGAHLDDRDEEASVRASAAWALGRIGTTVAVAWLGRHRDDPDEQVRDSVRFALEAALGSHPDQTD